MDILIALFSVSIYMLGFISILMTFRYRTWDTYIDNRKTILRSILKTNNKEQESKILINIQKIGKYKPEKDIIYHRSV